MDSLRNTRGPGAPLGGAGEQEQMFVSLMSAQTEGMVWSHDQLLDSL